MRDLQKIQVVIPGGGSGPISIEEVLLNFIPNITAITNITDNGGHTKQVRSILGVSPPGDATQRWAVRIRHNPQVRALLTYRFREDGARAGNTLLAAADRIGGGHCQGVKLIGEAFKAHIAGNVLPVSNDSRTQLKILFSDGSEIEGEENLDEFMKTAKNYLAVKVKFTPRSPKPNPEVLETLSKADLIIIPPGSRLGSLMSVLEVPRIFQTIKNSKAYVMCFTNAVDVKGYKSSEFLKYLYQKLGKKIDLAVINRSDFKLPTSYKKEHHFLVEPDKEECLKYSHEVVLAPIAKLYLIDNKPTIRHSGELATSLILRFLRDKKQFKDSPTLETIIELGYSAIAP